ncbi:hypothetical protein ACGFNX_19925 [Streptomyces sp. NPDC048723]|uniref:hypothetical protein n=1 Tax=Streptomyces sp. NPDC048723 TaxID=3365589 RepID=UPI003723EA07
MPMWLLAAVVLVPLTLIALCVFVAVLHPDTKRAGRAVEVLRELLRFLKPFSRL